MVTRRRPESRVRKLHGFPIAVCGGTCETGPTKSPAGSTIVQPSFLLPCLMPEKLSKSLSTLTIQQAGALMVLKADWRLHALSDNLATMLGAEQELEPGDDLADRLGRQFAHDSRGWAQGLDANSGMVRYLRHEGEAGILDLSITQVGERYVVSFEPARPGKTIARDALVQRFLHKLRPLSDVSAIAEGAAMQIRMFTQSDHVAIVLTDGEHGGQVLAQSGAEAFTLASSATSFRQLLPGVDDPGSAGMIVDTQDAGWLVRTADNEDPDIELQHSPLRQPKASTVVALGEQGARGALWFPLLGATGPVGLVLCRRATPRHCDAARRAATDLAVSYLALMIQAHRQG